MKRPCQGISDAPFQTPFFGQNVSTGSPESLHKGRCRTPTGEVELPPLEIQRSLNTTGRRCNFQYPCTPTFINHHWQKQLALALLHSDARRRGRRTGPKRVSTVQQVGAASTPNSWRQKTKHALHHRGTRKGRRISKWEGRESRHLLHEGADTVQRRQRCVAIRIRANRHELCRPL